MKRFWIILFIFSVSGISIDGSAAEKIKDLVENRKWNKCSDDKECSSVGERDQCSKVPIATIHSEKAYEELKKDWKPRCFGPSRICIPKCQKNKCVCEDGGKAPD